MAKIRSTTVYPYDTQVTKDDYVIGSNIAESGRTQNFKVGDIVELQNIVEYISDDIIPSYTPVVVINNLAYKLDPSNSNHQFAFYGFSTNGCAQGDLCRIKTFGELELAGWGLNQGSHYLVGPNGSLITDNTYPTNFTKVIGYAVTNDRIKIINDYDTISK